MILDLHEAMNITFEDWIYMIHGWRTVIKDKTALKLLRQKRNLNDFKAKWEIEESEYKEMMAEIDSELDKTIKDLYTLTAT